MTIPIVQERLTLEKRLVETGKVRIDERLARVDEELEYEDVNIERVAVNREVDHAPEVREVDGVLIVPVLEEVLIVEKRLVVKEELHIRKTRKRERFEQAVQVQGMHAEVERVNPVQAAGTQKRRDSEVTPAVAERTTRRSRLRRKVPLT
jgi:stress response protein YsnF